MPMATAVSERAIETPQRFLLHNVSWESYEALLAALADQRGLRITYDRGELELMNLSRSHEYFKKWIGRLIEAMVFELEIPIDSGGSLTWRRQQVQRGLEPDDCYWIANEPIVRGRTELDFEVDPPPDLAIEIDITCSSLDRQSIYAALGVPEIWRFDGRTLTAYRRTEKGEYEATEFSTSFPFLRVADLMPFIQPDETVDQTTRLRQFVQWVREKQFEL
jgi:Uma2 family endonuclease